MQRCHDCLVLGNSVGLETAIQRAIVVKLINMINYVVYQNKSKEPCHEKARWGDHCVMNILRNS